MNFDIPIQQVLESDNFIPHLVSSLLLIVTILVFRFFLIRAIRRVKTDNADLKRRWITASRDLSFAVLVICLLVIWAAELQSFALSLVAFAVAIVLATKELIICALGGVLKATNKPFRLGDRIEINGHRGDVIDHTLLTTTLEEIGPGRHSHQYTGRRLTLPNSVFLTNATVNESVNGDFALHTFTVPCSSEAEVLKQKAKLLAAAENVCGQHVEAANLYMQQLEQYEGLDAPNMRPRVSLSVSEHDHVDLVVRVPVPRRRTARTEQAILTEYFS